jgi:hypothetical protein
VTLPNEDDENLPLGLMAALSPGCLTLVLEQLERYRDDVGDGLLEGEDATQRELARIDRAREMLNEILADKRE